MSVFARPLLLRSLADKLAVAEAEVDDYRRNHDQLGRQGSSRCHRIPTPLVNPGIKSDLASLLTLLQPPRPARPASGRRCTRLQDRRAGRTTARGRVARPGGRTQRRCEGYGGGAPVAGTLRMSPRPKISARARWVFVGPSISRRVATGNEYRRGRKPGEQRPRIGGGMRVRIPPVGLTSRRSRTVSLNRVRTVDSARLACPPERTDLESDALGSEARGNMMPTKKIPPPGCPSGGLRC